MCTVSMVMDHYKDKWSPMFPNYPYSPDAVPGVLIPSTPLPIPSTATTVNVRLPVSREEFDQLRKDVLEMKELVKRAMKYDKDNNQADCENEDKVKLIRQIAEAVGVNVDDVFGGKNA